MAYCNPLHPPITSVKQSGYSSLNNATPGSGPSQFKCPFRRRIPQPIYTPNSKWRSSTGRTNTVQPAILFDNFGCSMQGVPMREFSNPASLSGRLVGAEDRVLAGTGLTRISFRIMWPGYTHLEWTRSIEIAVGGPVTRAQLGQKIAQNFSRFLEMYRAERPTSLDYEFGPNAIRFEHLVLVGLHNAFEDSWQADIAVDLR